MRDFTKTKRVVIKIGTNVLTKNSGIDTNYVGQVAGQVDKLLKSGKQVVIITSGAIGMGAGQLALAERPTNIRMRQACAAIGQPMLMAEYRKAFEQFGVAVAQVLLTAEVLNNRKTYLNLRNSIETLLKLGVVPILNENDSISTAEIGGDPSTSLRTSFGDNDRLSALVASKIDADLLIMLSDIDSLYDKDPKKYPSAKPIETVFEITEDILKSAGGKGSKFSAGGMKAKIEAAKVASNAGCRIVLADGRSKNVIERIIAGEIIGTVFMPKRKLSNRARWILNSTTEGVINIDEGAMKAVKSRKSLLPSGIKSIQGTFNAGDVIRLNDKAKAVTNFSSTELESLAGKHTSEIRKQLGTKRRDVVAIPEDIVFVDY
ncbi:MAG: glutamate 5-kinase [Phycisphaerae bacterium]|nr:glutamate 5-kinase [Phycisphaerae bacterium]